MADSLQDLKLGLILSGQSKTEINSSYLGTTRDAIHFLIYLEIDYLDSFQLGKPSAIGYLCT